MLKGRSSRGRTKKWCLAQFVWVLGMIPVSAAAVDAEANDVAPMHINLELSVGYHYSSGDYGLERSTEMTYVPVKIRGEIDWWTAELTVPYVGISGPANIFPGGIITEDDGRSQSESGLGDVLARVSYTFLPITTWMPFFELGGEVKFPTADEGRGLGTGEFDFIVEGGGVWVRDNFTPFAVLGYRFFGDSSAFDLNDVFFSSVGVGYQALQRLNVGLLFDYREATSDNAGELMELVPFLNWKVTRHWSANMYASAGLAEGSADGGVGLQINYSWRGEGQ